MSLPRVELVTGLLTTSDAEVLAIGLHPGGDGAVPGAEAEAVARELAVDFDFFLDRAEATGKAGEVVEVPVNRPGSSVHTLLLVGLGDRTPLSVRRAGAALARRTGKAQRLATATAAGLDEDALRAHVEGLLLATYRFTRSSAKKPDGALRQVDVHLRATAGQRRAVELAQVTAEAAHLARDLANTPSDEKDPAWLAARATELGRRTGLQVSVRDEKALAREGFGGLVAVGAGSARPPRLIELSYTPAKVGRRTPHVVLVGKGITFDSGGLSLKPREAMVPMKTDMAAGGAVLAVMAGLRDAGVRVRVTALVAAAENLPGASAYRPGDVITQYGGRTVEVFNTDAEGRLVLADALAYADLHLDPDVLVDIATLTGAASQGLGRRHAALYTADESLAAELEVAAEGSGERVWRMPLVEDYRAALDSEVADIAHVSRDPKISGGSITAALFLREFVGARRWVHLDIAGPARADRDEHEVTKGGTGYGARLLLRWLEALR
ncbi:MAG: leucyl aminopeptidase [Actinomycetes bacterium]